MLVEEESRPYTKLAKLLDISFFVSDFSDPPFLIFSLTYPLLLFVFTTHDVNLFCSYCYYVYYDWFSSLLSRGSSSPLLLRLLSP